MVADNLKLDGKLVIITGAGRGLGRAMATRLAGAGADIVAAARTVEQLEETAAEVRRLGRKCLIVPTDVSRSDQVNAMAAAALKEFGHVDALINNAGAGEDSFGKPIEEISDDEWHRGIDNNLSSQFYCARAVLPHMVGRKRGKIVNVASMLSFQGGINVVSYAAAKSAVAGVTRSLANEWAPLGINVNAIAPGYFATDNTAPLRADADRDAAILGRIPAGRWGTPADLQGTVVYLSSAASDYVHGSIVAVDGGWLAR